MRRRRRCRRRCCCCRAWRRRAAHGPLPLRLACTTKQARRRRQGQNRQRTGCGTHSWRRRAAPASLPRSAPPRHPPLGTPTRGAVVKVGGAAGGVLAFGPPGGQLQVGGRGQAGEHGCGKVPATGCWQAAEADSRACNPAGQAASGAALAPLGGQAVTRAAGAVHPGLTMDAAGRVHDRSPVVGL